LAKEIRPAWNIRICIVEPGSFQTNILASGDMVYPDPPAYGDLRSALAADFAGVIGTTYVGDPHKFTKSLYSVVAGDKIPLHLPMGQDALAMVKRSIMQLSTMITDAEPWSTDLKRDDTGVSAE